MILASVKPSGLNSFGKGNKSKEKKRWHHIKQKSFSTAKNILSLKHKEMLQNGRKKITYPRSDKGLIAKT